MTSYPTSCESKEGTYLRGAHRLDPLIHAGDLGRKEAPGIQKGDRDLQIFLSLILLFSHLNYIHLHTLRRLQ